MLILTEYGAIKIYTILIYGNSKYVCVRHFSAIVRCIPLLLSFFCSLYLFSINEIYIIMSKYAFVNTRVEAYQMVQKNMYVHLYKTSVQLMMNFQKFHLITRLDLRQRTQSEICPNNSEIYLFHNVNLCRPFFVFTNCFVM